MLSLLLKFNSEKINQMQNIQHIQNLLSQVNTITKSYDRVNKATGDNFNIFSVLKIEHYEETTHSRFIAELLDANGSHGFDNLFLKAFIDEVSLTKDHFNIKSYSIFTEIGIGTKTETTGGRIDILLKDHTNRTITIENKIYATEEENQLLRYHNYNPNGELIYLTLNGQESDLHKLKFKNGECFSDKYIQVSYNKDIINWLNKCQTIAIENPVVRETIKQYKNLVKKLTNQNINSEMNQELIELLTNSEESFDNWNTLQNLNNKILDFVFTEKIIPILGELKKELNEYEFIYDENALTHKKGTKYLTLLEVKSKKLSSNHAKIFFEFQNSNANYLLGVLSIEKNKEIANLGLLKLNFEETFKNFKPETNNGHIGLFHYYKYMNLGSDMNHLKNVIFGDFKNDLKEKIELMHSVFD